MQTAGGPEGRAQVPVDERALARAMDTLCRELEANAPTVLEAAARLTAAWLLATGMAVASRPEDVEKVVEAGVRAFLQRLAVLLGHGGWQLRRSRH